MTTLFPLSGLVTMMLSSLCRSVKPVLAKDVFLFQEVVRVDVAVGNILE